ncbi:MAG: phage terminase large subunit, partial [Bryobacterales bacterium]|nr:phage terminase large subunit [Bryobacterales bacterium]
MGSGKSQALCQEAIRLAFVNGGTMGLLGAPTYPMLRDATRRALLTVLEENEIPFVHHKSESTIELTQNGSKILLRSLDEYERLRGTNLAWFGIDELTYCKEDAWLRLEGRLREPKASQHCGFAVWTPKGKDWVYRRFVGEKNPEYAVIFARPRENRHILKTDPGFYDRLQRTYSDAFYRQEVLGEYLLSDNRRVYAGFSREVHEEAVELDPERPLLWALDFNVSPFCSVLCQRYGDDLYVLDELV